METPEERLPGLPLQPQLLKEVNEFQAFIREENEKEKNARECQPKKEFRE